MPEFIARQDGAEKQDCERNAANRWLAAHAEGVKGLRPIYLGDDLFACQPIAEAIMAAGGDLLLTAKPSSHKALYDFMDGATIEERTVTEKLAGKRLAYRYRWFEQAPLREGKDAMLVNWVRVTITDAKGKTTYDSAFVTSLPVTRETVAKIVACARARRKTENESFNFLKSNGYHLEHNFGHGQPNLATMVAALNRLAFAIHTVCDCLEQIWIDARTAKRARKRFFEHIRTITAPAQVAGDPLSGLRRKLCGRGPAEGATARGPKHASGKHPAWTRLPGLPWRTHAGRRDRWQRLDVGGDHDALPGGLRIIA